MGAWDTKREIVRAPRRVKTGSGTFTHPEISRDGARLAVWGLSGSHAMVRCFDLNSGRPIWESPAGWVCCHPTWSPDGTHVAFACSTNNANRKRIPGTLYDTSRFAPRQIWITNLKTGECSQATTSGMDKERPAWSPDGTRLAFVANHRDQSAICVAAIAAQSERFITDCNGRPCFRPVWHPDGERIIFNTKGPGNHCLWVVRHGGSGLGQLTPEATGQARIWDHGAWCSADGASVLFHSNRGGSPALWLIDIGGKNLRQVEVEGFKWSAHGTWNAAQTRIAFDAPLVN